MNCKKCGARYYKTTICRDCGFIPLHEEKDEQLKSIIRSLLNELPKKRQDSYINRLKEMGVL